MNYLNSLTLAWQQDETSKEAGDNSMAVKPLCGDPVISKSQRQEEEHMAKAKLPEAQTDTGGSHPLFTPDKGQHSYGARSLCCASVSSHRSGADNMSDNGRTGRLSAYNHFYLCTTGSPNQEVDSCMATESPYYPMCRINVRGTQPERMLGAKRGITAEQSEGKPLTLRGKGDSQSLRRTLERRTTNVDR
jgi:hypothetical protein